MRRRRFGIRIPVINAQALMSAIYISDMETKEGFLLLWSHHKDDQFMRVNCLWMETHTKAIHKAELRKTVSAYKCGEYQ